MESIQFTTHMPFRPSARLSAAATAANARERRRRWWTLYGGGTVVLAVLCLATVTAWAKARWSVGALQAAVLAGTFVYLQILLWKKRRPTVPLTALLALFAGATGLAQIAFSSTVYEYATREAALQWLVLACAAFAARNASAEAHQRRYILAGLVALGGVAGTLTLLSLASPQTRILWLIETASPEVAGFFLSTNEFAQFAELIVPIALLRAFGDRKRWHWYVLVAAILAGGVIGVRSRMGSAMILLESIAALWLAKQHRTVATARWRVVAGTMAGLFLLLAATVGPEGLLRRFASEDLRAGRETILRSSTGLIEDRWLRGGHGLGTFPHVYPAYATAELKGFVNHAHNDWVEALSDGGLPLFLTLLAIFGCLMANAFRYPWALGIPAIAIHALVDFPLQRFGITLLLFALMGMLEAAAAEQSTVNEPAPRGPAPDECGNGPLIDAAPAI